MRSGATDLTFDRDVVDINVAGWPATPRPWAAWPSLAVSEVGSVSSWKGGSAPGAAPRIGPSSRFPATPLQDSTLSLPPRLALMPKGNFSFGRSIRFVHRRHKLVFSPLSRDLEKRPLQTHVYPAGNFDPRHQHEPSVRNRDEQPRCKTGYI